MVGARRAPSKLFVLTYYTLWGAMDELGDHLGGSPVGGGGGHVRAYTWTPHRYHGSHVAIERKKKVPRVLHALYIRVASTQREIGFERTCR